MAGLNKVMIIGHLGADPVAKSFQNGGEVVNMRIATSETWKDKNSGERKEKTEWHSIAVYTEGLCRVAKQYLRKGSKVYVEGKLATRKWQDQQGNDHYSTEIVLQGYDAKILMLDGREGGDQGGGRVGGGATSNSSPAEGARRQSAFDSDLDDDVPF